MTREQDPHELGRVIGTLVPDPPPAPDRAAAVVWRAHQHRRRRAGAGMVVAALAVVGVMVGVSAVGGRGPDAAPAALAPTESAPVAIECPVGDTASLPIGLMPEAVHAVLTWRASDADVDVVSSCAPVSDRDLRTIKADLAAPYDATRDGEVECSPDALLLTIVSVDASGQAAAISGDCRGFYLDGRDPRRLRPRAQAVVDRIVTGVTDAVASFPASCASGMSTSAILDGFPPSSLADAARYPRSAAEAARRTLAAPAFDSRFVGAVLGPKAPDGRRRTTFLVLRDGVTVGRIAVGALPYGTYGTRSVEGCSP